jgi:hypothetical protein
METDAQKKERLHKLGEKPLGDQESNRNNQEEDSADEVDKRRNKKKKQS